MRPGIAATVPVMADALRTRIAAAAAFIGLSAVAVFMVRSAGSREDAVEWMAQAARPFETCEPSARTDDLAALEDIVGDARIVALGEGTHGTREFFELKHRIVQHLVTEMGFTVFAIEASMPDAWLLNDYVLYGYGEPRALLAGLGFWTWNTAEVLAMVEWMRAWNASGRGRVEFIGFDMQSSETAAGNVRDFLARHDPAWADSVAEPDDPGFVTSTGTLPAADFAGRRVRFSGMIRTEGVTGFAGLWMRADAPGRKAIAFDNMERQGVTGTREWKRYVIELTIPRHTSNINFGMLLSGAGLAWFDALEIEVDGRPWRSESVDLDLEAFDGPRGFGRIAMHPRYWIRMNDRVAFKGERSLLLGGAYRAAGDGAFLRRLVQHVESSREHYAAIAGTLKAQALIRDVHVLLQNARREAGRRRIGHDAAFWVRDSCMAANVAWIADEARPGERIVLWAHNRHVAREKRWMGRLLAERYGNDYVPVAFAAREGRYTAVSKEGALSSGHVLREPPARSVEALASATRLPRFLLDLRPAREDPAAERALRVVPMRSIGARAEAHQFIPTALLDDYDALAWIEQTHATRITGVMR